MLAKHRINSPSHILATIPTAVNSTHAQAPPPTSSDFSGGKKKKKKTTPKHRCPSPTSNDFSDKKKNQRSDLSSLGRWFFFFVRRKSRRKWLELGGWRHRRDLPQNRILMPQN
jgi:hypothetical protein